MSHESSMYYCYNVYTVMLYIAMNTKCTINSPELEFHYPNGVYTGVSHGFYTYNWKDIGNSVGFQ